MLLGGYGCKWMRYIAEAKKIRDEYDLLPWYKKLITRNPRKDYTWTYFNLGKITIRLED